MFLKSTLVLPSTHITFLLSLALFPWQPYKSAAEGPAVLEKAKEKDNGLGLAFFSEGFAPSSQPLYWVWRFPSPSCVAMSAKAG